MKSSVREIKIKLPENVLLSASISEKQLVQEMREVIAFKLFAEGRLSGGTAAKLAGMPRVKFLLKAGQLNVEWLPYSKDEVRRELS
jgi:predicted HTH domain antitoxin